MSENSNIKALMDEGSFSKASLKRKRKISENTARNATASLLLPLESRYWTRSMKSDCYAANSPKKSRKQVTKSSKLVKYVEPTTLLTDLPNELIGKIANYLSFDDLFKFERVNQRFRAIAIKYSWPQKKTVDHDAIILNTDYPKISLAEERSYYHRLRRHPNRRHNITATSIKMLFSRATVRGLDLSVYHTTLTYQISPLFSMIPQLTSLNLSYIRLTNNSLRTIAQYCNFLEEVSFEQCFCDGKVEQGLEVLFTKCQNIKYLNLSENNKLYGESFAYVPIGLIYLNLANCYNVNANSIGALAEAAVNLETLILENYDNAAVANFNSWLGKLKKLRFLEVSNIFMGQDYPALDFSNFEELEMLCLRYNTLVSAASLRTLQSCPKLKAIDLRFGSQFDNSSLDLLKKCKSLKYCNLSNWLQLSDVVDFIKSLKLEYLSINDCREIGEEVVHKILTECHSLRYLELLGLHIDYHKVLPAALKEECPQRRDVLSLAAPCQNPTLDLPPCNWAKIIPCDSYGPSPFGRFTHIRSQYYK